jgi:hypothetical protein
VYVNSLGNIEQVKIMNGGSSYSVGDSLSIVGIATTTGHSVGIVSVTGIYNNVGDVISVSRVLPLSNSQYNTSYRITGISTGLDTKIETTPVATIGIGETTLIVGDENLSRSNLVLAGRSFLVSSLTYNNTTGIATVVTNQANGFRVDNKIRLFGANSSLYNNEFVIKKTNSVTSFEVNIGVTDSSPATTGTIYVFRPTYTSHGGVITEDNENLGGRSVVEYAGITTVLSADILTSTATTIDIQNVELLDINIGDYLQIGEEIVRVRETVSTDSVTGSAGIAGNPITIFRGVLATQPTNSITSPLSHALGCVVRKVNVRPIEFRRNSIMRASGHTFEYVGFGPGNYSTALPDKQDRTISPAEELLSQSTKKSGGINVFTGMNNDGDFYIGNKKVSSATGQEEVFDSPVPSVVGEDVSAGGLNIGFDVLTPLEVSISRSLRIEGGPDGNLVSEFDGPIILNNKFTSTSEKGIEATSLFLQGDATVSRKQTVGISTPILAGNPGDVTWNANPDDAGYLGWVYTRNNNWKRVGQISLERDQSVNVFDKVGIATTSPGDCTLKVGSGTSIFCVDGSGVGIGTTANEYKLQVVGNSNFVGYVTATGFVGDGSGLTGLQNDSLWSGVSAGLGTGIYPNDLTRIGIGTSAPRYDFEVGSPGTGATSLYVNNLATFADQVSANNVNVTGVITATNFRLSGSSGSVNAGVITATTLLVGTGGTALTVSTTGRIGVGTTSPRDKLDVDGHLRLRTYSENVGVASIVAGVVTIDLSVAQTFTLELTSNVTQFTILNPPTGSTAFTMKLTQDAVGGRSVGIDTFRNGSGTPIPIYWSGGGAVPNVTTTASRADIYSFKTFDSGSSFYGVVGGQNFV